MARLVLLLLFLAAPLHAQQALSGRYGELILVVRPDGTLEGAFSSARGGPDGGGVPPFTCIFFLSGRLEGEEGAVRASHPGDPNVIDGRLRVTGARAFLRFTEDPPGCTNVVGDMTRQPYELEWDAPGRGWIGARLVTRRAALRAGPGPDRPRRRTLLGIEAVALLRQEAGWALVEGPGVPRGWLRLGDLSSPVTSPRTPAPAGR